MKTHVGWMWSQTLLHAIFWKTIVFSIAFPHTHKFLIERIPSGFLSMEMIVTAVATITVNALYMRYSDRIFAHFKLFCVMECTVYAVVLPLIGCGKITPACYFIIDVVAGAVLCRPLYCCGNRLRKLVYDREARENYDNSQPVVMALAAVIGGSVGMLPIPLWAAWCLIAVGIVIDDVFYWVTYNRVTR